ncbi:DUF2793 domain-containing protein [Mesorhizobium sp.]|uniref:DUF2793 domain-containing protein n=1 Tax=Mesorhizobium sp. TaxID=1871066 RepID=UPI000FE50CA5|nr:DUF2793 domain-containing protein [Mesorhizobium sp.]RWF66836.1 MAG: DUF2793 domain-containing protein [Mesorhizobium sp.]
MTISNRLGITELATSQVDRSVTVNEAIAFLEAAAGNFAAVAVGTNSPPGSPAEGDLYVIGASPTGAWTGKAKYATVYYNATWLFMAPIEGYRAYDQTANAKYIYDGSSWSLDTGGSFTTASTTEVLSGTDTSKGVTPDALAAIWEKGSNVASASTVSLGEGGFFHITGTTTVTDIDWATAKDGRAAFVIFDGALTLTHNATTLKLPGGANITTAAGDRAIFVQDSGDNVICIAYIRADGTPLLSTILRSDTSANLTKGYTATGYSAGTKSSGTFTPDPANGNFQYATNGGAHTLAPPSTGTGDSVSLVLDYTNNGSAGAITTSGFTKVSGDAFDTTNAHKFRCYITVGNAGSHLNVVALQ